MAGELQAVLIGEVVVAKRPVYGDPSLTGRLKEHVLGERQRLIVNIFAAICYVSKMEQRGDTTFGIDSGPEDMLIELLHRRIKDG